MTSYEVLKREFNIETHKATFINYLEVVIHKDGKIEYAVPSHNKKMEQIICAKYNLRFDSEYMESVELIKLFDKTGRSYGDWFDWLLDESEVILVWGNGYRGQPNAKQLEVLTELKIEGLYKGIISN